MNLNEETKIVLKSKFNETFENNSDFIEEFVIDKGIKKEIVNDVEKIKNNKIVIAFETKNVLNNIKYRIVHCVNKKGEDISKLEINRDNFWISRSRCKREDELNMLLNILLQDAYLNKISQLEASLFITDYFVNIYKSNSDLELQNPFLYNSLKKILN